MIPEHIDDALVYADWLEDNGRPGLASMVRTIDSMDYICHAFMYSCDELGFFGTKLACHECKVLFVLISLLGLISNENLSIGKSPIHLACVPINKNGERNEASRIPEEEP